MNKKHAPKIKVEFITDCETNDPVVSNALKTQLMVVITQIGIRVDNPDNMNGKINKGGINAKENN